MGQDSQGSPVHCGQVVVSGFSIVGVRETSGYDGWGSQGLVCKDRLDCNSLRMDGSIGDEQSPKFPETLSNFMELARRTTLPTWVKALMQSCRSEGYQHLVFATRKGTVERLTSRLLFICGRKFWLYFTFLICWAKTSFLILC